MWQDPIVEEIRKYRAEHAAKFNYDLDAIVHDFQKQERESGRKVVSLSHGDNGEDRSAEKAAEDR